MVKRSEQGGIAVLIAILLCCACVLFTRTGRNPDHHTVSLLEALAAIPNLSTYSELLASSGLASTLQSPGPWTLFAPINKAFEDLPLAMQRYYFTSNSITAYRIHDQLRYTIHAGELARERFRTGKVSTIHGESLLLGLTTNNSWAIDRANLIGQSITATNGVIHPVDALNISNLWR